MEGLPGTPREKHSKDPDPNSFFQSIFDQVQTGLVIIDPESHRIIDANHAAVQMIGTDKKDIIGEVCHKFICPADKGRCPITDLKQTIDRSDRILLQANGNRLPIIKSAGFITLNGRQYLLENFFDNSERVRSGAAEADTKRILRAVFDQTFQFIGLMTPNGTLIDANRSALKFCGISEQDVIGKPFWDTPWWTHSQKLQEQLRTGILSAAQGEFVRFEASHVAADGSLHYIDFSLKPVSDDSGRVIYLIPEGRDITDRKIIEDELAKKNADLYAACEQITAVEEELRQNYEKLARNERDLQESERRIRAVFDQTFQFIGLMTPNGTLIDANRSALKFCGISEQDVIGKPFWDTPWWTHSQKLQEQLRTGILSAAQGEFVRFEASHVAADGSFHYIDFSLKPVSDDSGRVIYLIPEGRDITDRKIIEDELAKKNADLYAAYEQLTAAEEELRQNYDELVRSEKELSDRESKIRAMFQQTFQFIDLLSKEGFILETNRPLADFSVADFSALAAVPYHATPIWSYSVEIRNKIQNAVLSAARGVFTRFEIQDIADDGAPRYTDFSIKPVRNQDGSILYLIAESRDITSLRITSQALEESENIYRAIFGNTGTAMALIEEDTTIGLANTEFEHLSGYSREEIEGHMSWTQFVDPEDLKRMQELHVTRRNGSKEVPSQYEFRFQTKSGGKRDIFLTVDLIPGTRKSIASLMDITERNQMTRKLTATLQEKEILLREIHHRVKNNLQIIISLLNLQSRSFGDTAVLGAIRECQNRVRAMALVHEKMYQSENLSEINITEYTRYLASYLFQFYGVEGEIIRFTIQGDDIRIGIHTAVPLGLIINELLSNALKHAFPKKRSGEILVRLDKTDSDIVIVISDNGIGFPKNYDWKKSESLGLMLVQSLIAQVLGTMEIDTAKGTEYRLTIPVKRIDCDAL